MRTTLARSGAALAAAFAIAAVPLVAHAADPVNETPLRLETGHIDAFNLVLNDDGSVRLTLKEDVTGSHVLHTPESVELFVKDEAYRTGLPPAYLPEGAPTELYFLPITQDQNLIWPGWDSQSVGPQFGQDANVDIVVNDVDGPGDVYLWSQGVFGDPTRLLTNGWTFPGTIHQDFLAHVHANWGFTAPGTYRLTAHAVVTSEDGTRSATTNTATYTFVVGTTGGGEEPPVDTTLAITGVPQNYHTGDVATLTAVQSPEPVSDHYHWFTRPSADAEWTAVEGATTGTYGFVVTQPQQVKAAVYDEDHRVIAESEPVDVVIDDHGETPFVGPQIESTLPANEGALVVSVAPESRRARLSDLTLDSSADRYVSEGAITGITVTDTRQDAPGWNASGRVRGLVSIGGGTLDGRYLGWTPTVVSTSTGATATPGEPVAPGFATGTGLKSWTPLASAPAGASLGTTVLGADLRIEAPLATKAGTYTGVVLITVI